MKKLIALVLALTLCAGLAVPVLAAGELPGMETEGETISATIGAISEPTQELTIGAETAPESAPEDTPGELDQEEKFPTINFEDIPEDHAFYSAIMDCAAKGITSGYSDGTFRPTNSVTKAQFAVMLSRAFYAGEVEKYNTKVYTDQGWFVPNTRALYMAGVLTDTSFVSYFATSDIMSQTINRYDMAQLITNIMTAKGFSATETQKSEIQEKIADYKNIPANYQDAVKNVFALGIITGYSDGTYSGQNIMNRGQGCVVIYRMTQYTPAVSPTSTNDMTSDGGKVETPATPVPATPKPETQMPSQPETPAVKTLSNGKPVTEANVLALLNELKAKYPESANFGRTGYPAGQNSTDARAAIRSYPSSQGGYTSTTAGCGGWAALVSDYIFGQTGFPTHQVNYKETRPGDIIIELNNNNRVMHVLIATSRPYHDPECENTRIRITDSGGGTTADPSGYVVNWSGEAVLAYDDGFMPGQVVVWTRYPS